MISFFKFYILMARNLFNLINTLIKNVFEFEEFDKSVFKLLENSK